MEFEKGKRYRFSKERYEQGRYLPIQKGEWAYDCIGKEVDVIDGHNGMVAGYGVETHWCEEIKENTQEEINMILKYKGGKATSLTEGGTYSGKLDSKGNLRIKGDNGNWSKYGANGFDVISMSETDIQSFKDNGIEVPSIFVKHPANDQVVESQVQDCVTYSVADAMATQQVADALMRKGYADMSTSITKETMDELTRQLMGVTPQMTGNKAEVIPHVYQTPTFGGKASAIKSKEEVEDEFRANVDAIKEKIKQNTNMKAGTQPMKKQVTLRSYLQGQGVVDSLIDELAEFRKENVCEEAYKNRIVIPNTLYVGGKIWTTAITAILQKQHILLRGAKATGKNVLANNLSFACGRPLWDISFHVNMDSSSLIGADTFKNNQVEFRPGAVYQCALYGGFGVLDEVNMAKPEAMAVLHSVTDDRRVIDVPGYDRLKLNDATRFIGTMNYGYAGTRELNEAFASRFVIIDVPQLTDKELTKLLASKYPKADNAVLELYSGLFGDLQKKAENAEISTKAVDLRGMLAALGMTAHGMKPYDALECNIVNKCFDKYERDIVSDVVKTRIPQSWSNDRVFPTNGSMTINFGGAK